MKDNDTDTANAPVTPSGKYQDAEIEDVIKASEEESFLDPGDGYRIWRCNGVPVGLRIRKKRS